MFVQPEKNIEFILAPSYIGIVIVGNEKSNQFADYTTKTIENPIRYNNISTNNIKIFIY